MSGDSNVERPGALAFDSTQTVRASPARELRDPNQQKWFAVQLAVSDRPANLETLPRFEVFAFYRVYAIQGRLGANACHALRLGFFSEQESARAICADLRAFYRSASVVQVSAAEQARFGARQIELARNTRHSTKQQNTSWLSRWLGRSND